MAQLSYLLRRGASYYARARVPLDLVDVLGKTEIVKALGTKDKHEAKRRLWPVIEGWNRDFDDARARLAIDEDRKAVATWQHYKAVLERDEAVRQAMPTSSDIEDATEAAVADAQAREINPADKLGMLDAGLEVMAMKERRKFDANNRAVKIAELRKHLAEGETALVEHEVDLHLDQRSIDRSDLARRLIRAEIEGLQRTLERDAGDYSGAPKDPIVKPAIGVVRETAKPGERIMELFEQYAAENPRRISADTMAQARRDVGCFADHVGRSFPVQRIDKKAVREWKALVMKLPVKASEMKEFAGMSLEKIVEHNKTVQKPVIVTRTINRYLSGLSSFCAWLVNNGHLEQNPVEGMALTKEQKTKTAVFTVDQLNVLFKSPLFAGCRGDSDWREIGQPGIVRIRDHRYWLPLVMLFSGARPAEIAQLAVGDVRQEHGHWIMHVTIEGDGEKSVKTAGSMRVVPIHEELMKLGFVEFRNAQEAAGHKRLFPEATRNSRGQMAADFSRGFGRYLERLKLKSGRGISAYSFRHGVADALRRAGHLDQEFGFLLGHTSGTMTGRYGHLPQGQLEQRVSLVNSIRYGELRLAHLYVS